MTGVCGLGEEDLIIPRQAAGQGAQRSFARIGGEDARSQQQEHWENETKADAHESDRIQTRRTLRSSTEKHRNQFAATPATARSLSIAA